MRIDVPRPAELTASHLDDWRALERLDRRPNPFLAPDYTQAVGSVRDDAHVAVIDGGRAFFPFEKRGAIGLPIGSVLSDLQGMAAEPGLAVAPRELLKACDLKVWAFDHLDPAQFAHGQKALHPSPVIDLTGGYDVYAKGLAERSSKIYKSTLKKERRLARRSARSGSTSTPPTARPCAPSSAGSRRSTAAPAAPTASPSRGSSPSPSASTTSGPPSSPAPSACSTPGTP